MTLDLHRRIVSETKMASKEGHTPELPAFYVRGLSGRCQLLASFIVGPIYLGTQFLWPCSLTDPENVGFHLTHCSFGVTEEGISYIQGQDTHAPNEVSLCQRPWKQLTFPQASQWMLYLTTYWHMARVHHVESVRNHAMYH